MYGRIPKKKALRAKPEEWILSKDNILAWQNDLDAFESALYATDIDQGEKEVNPLEELNLDMEWIDPKSAVGKSLYKWWPAATANRHSYIKDMKIRNIWRVGRHEDQGKLVEVQKKIVKEKPEIQSARYTNWTHVQDIKKTEHKLYSDSNTGLLFHGNRSR